MDRYTPGCKIKNSLSVNVLFTISHQHFSDGYFFKGERHNFYEIVCVLKGSVGVTAGKNIFILSEGEMTLHCPGEFHAIWEHKDQPSACIVLFLFRHCFPANSFFSLPPFKRFADGNQTALSSFLPNFFHLKGSPARALQRPRKICFFRRDFSKEHSPRTRK